MSASLADRAALGTMRLARAVQALTGWRRALFAAALGMAASAALPPIHALPLLPLAFTGLLWLVEGARRRREAFGIGWWFGFGHFLLGLYWIAHALLVDPWRFGWLIPFAVPGLAAGLALFPAAAALALKLAGVGGISGALVLALAWTGAEWLRGHVLTGFPWNLIGLVWSQSEAMMQGAAWVGVYGLGLITVAGAALPASLAAQGAPALARWTGVFAAAGVLGLGWGAGLMRLSAAGDEGAPEVRLRLVQPNVRQDLKWDPVLREEHFQRALSLSRGPGAESRTHIIWPETAAPFAIASEPARLQALAAVVPPGGVIVTGAPRVAGDGPGQYKFWNSLHAVDDRGIVVGTYDKFHLVPFGEYVPFRGLLGIAKLTVGTVDFSAGPGPRTLALPGLPKVSPLICYEAIFPGRALDPADRPAWLLNLTNDAWFGLSSGPYQHFAAARLRAVEEGLPLVRVANNGISGVVDAYGRVTARLGLGRTGILDADLPRPIDPPPYARYGDRTVLALAAPLLALAWLLRRRG
ncbi:MAG: apolipoprotein N-acyltransferase [Pseudomonadota bacterium]